MVGAFDGGEYPTTWYWQDGRGNSAFLTDDAGNMIERYSYDLAGAPRIMDYWQNVRSGSIYDVRFLFGGSQYLPEANVYDMRNRVYHVELNRFLQTDPIGFKGDALNLYRYCGNDPVDRTGRDGLEFTAEITLRPNLDGVGARVDPRQFGATTGDLAITAHVVSGRVVVDVVDLHATSYVRTTMRYGGEEKPRSKLDITRTVNHEARRGKAGSRK